VDDLRRAVEDFRRHLEEEKAVSSYTQKSYMTDLQQFVDFMERPGTAGGTGVESLTMIEPSDVRGFLVHLYQKKVRKSSMSRKVSALRSFFRFLVREGKIRINPAEAVQSPKIERYLPTFLQVDEMFTLLNDRVQRRCLRLEGQGDSRTDVFLRYQGRRACRIEPERCRFEGRTS